MSFMTYYSMRSKLTLLLFIIALTALTYLGYPIIKSRYFSVGSKSIVADPEIQAEKDNKETPNENNVIFESDSLEITVVPSDCDNECSKFKKNDELEYCKEVCGLSALEKKPEESNNCESKSGLQKDYCLKGLGISKKDFKACNQIADGGIKKTCKNRITEDIIESQ
jgi:hypothetical protein